VSQMDRASDVAGEGHATSRLRTNAANTAARMRRLRPIVNDARDPSLIDRHAVRPLACWVPVAASIVLRSERITARASYG
jgi:hypothetical protein